MMLWSIDETARQLGEVSTRTVRRMVERGELPTVKVGRLVRIPASAAHEWQEEQMSPAHNDNRAGRDVQGGSTCRRSARPEIRTVSKGGRIRRTGGRVSPMKAADELAAVLELSTARKRRHS